MTAAHPKPASVHDSNANPARLAAIGAQVTRRIEKNPRIERIVAPGIQLYACQGFLSDDDCAYLVARIDAGAVPSTLYKGTEQEGFRTSSTFYFGPGDTAALAIDRRINQVLGLRDGNAEPMQGQRYFAGQQFKPHHDFFHTTESYWRKEGPNGGQRTWTAMVFLNEPVAGGVTDFPQVGIGIRPVAGMMLIWNNMKADGTPNHKTLHAGTPVTAGAKYIITKWFRLNLWRMPKG
jgi:prolyl 4-hydroxylase